MRSGGNNLNYFTDNQLTKFTVSTTAGLLVNFGHTLSVGLLVGYGRPYRRRLPCTINTCSSDWPYRCCWSALMT